MLTMSDFSPVKSAFKIYPASLHEENDSCVFIADIGDRTRNGNPIQRWTVTESAFADRSHGIVHVNAP